MVLRKEEIVVWFSRQPSHQRLDVLCTLASICLPFEVRFINTCVDFLAKRIASASARDAEILAALEKSCCPQPGEVVDLQEEAARRKLIWTLSLLHSNNRMVAHTVYGILREACADFRLFPPLTDTAASAGAAGSYPQELSTACQELHLIFTMVLHHPAFTFEEKMQLGEIYLCLQTRLPGMRPPSPPVVTPAPTPSPPESAPAMPPTSGPPADRSPTNGRSGNHRGNLGTGHHSSRNKSRPSGQLGQHGGQQVHQSNRSSSNGSTSGDSSNNGINVSITSLLREQLGKDGHHAKHQNPHLPKAWQQFEHLSSAELASCSDEEFIRSGLTTGFVSLLRKILNQLQPSLHQYNHHQGSRPNSSNGLAEDSGSSSHHYPKVQGQQHQQIGSNKQPPSGPHRSSLVKTSCMGPPNVQPAFNHTQRSQTAETQHHHHQQQQQQEAPLSRAGSSSSSGSSSLEACSPPSSPTDSSTVAHRSGDHQHRKPFSGPQPVILPSGARPQTRGPSSNPSGTLRGTNNNNLGFLRHLGSSSGTNTAPTITITNSSSLHRHGPSCSSSCSSSSSSSSASSTSSSTSTSSSSSASSSSSSAPLTSVSVSTRAASQPREVPYPVSLSFTAPPQPVGGAAGVVPAGPLPATAQPASPFIVDSSTPPPQLEAQPTAPALPVYSYHGYLPINGDGASYQQAPFTFITSGPPPSSARLGPSGPHHAEMMYSPGSYLVSSQIVAQPMSSHHGGGSNGNGRHVIEVPFLPPGTFIVATTRADGSGGTDYSRPPPPGTSGPSPIPLVAAGNVSCFNCGASGHRGPQCQQISVEEIIRPSPA